MRLPISLAFLLGTIGPVFCAPFDYHSVRGREARGPVDGILEGELLPRHGTARTQGMRNFGEGWRGDAHLLWDGEPGQEMTTEFRIEEAGIYEVSARMTLAPDYGIFSVALDGKVLRREIDLFSPTVSTGPLIELGKLPLTHGEHKLAFKLTGANPKASTFQKSRYLLGLDFIKVINLLPSEPPPADTAEPPEVATSKVTVTFKEVQPILATYCYGCHGEKGKVKGKANLKELTSPQDFLSRIELVGKAAEATTFQEMPPDEAKQPTEEERKKLTAFFNGYLEKHLQDSGHLKPVVMRRLNRYEYNNAAKDLLELKGDLYPLPEKVIRSRGYFNPASGRFPDSIQVSNRALGKNQIEQHILTGVSPFAIDLQAEHGFNNQGDQLSVSPILLESFLKLGRSIVNAREFDGYSALTDSFFRAPDEKDHSLWPLITKQRLQSFLERAFRSAIDESTLNRYVSFAMREVSRHGDYSLAMKSVTAAVLASPRFLYLTERKREASAEEPLTPYELAARLSFFLWSTLPDEELITSARNGDLSKPDVYAAHIRRMLESPKSKALAENFARQWLRLDQLITAVPDFDRFQIYYSRIGCEQWKFGLQTMAEPLLLFESIMVEDRSIMLLIDSNYSYRSDEMASWYKDAIPFRNRGNRNRFNTGSQRFSRRSLTSRREGGVITSAAALTMTSEPLRTSPIRRGAWVATVILNRPPPPPPDIIPEIEQDDAVIEAKGLTLRQRLVAHQENESCVSCHQKIDPLGFALENYDAIGRWRDTYRSGLPIDASGTLYGKAQFQDVIGLKDVLLGNPEWFIRGFSEHLLAYALGREIDISDKPALDKIVRAAMTKKGQFSTIVSEIATSYPFMHKTNQLAPPPVKNPEKP